MSSKIIEARAIITAKDSTGAEFDKVAKKLQSVVKAADAFTGMKPLGGGLGNLGWGPKFQKDIEALKIGGQELAKIQQQWERFNSAMARNGPLAASKYFGAVDQWKDKTLANLREVRLGMSEHEAAHKKFFTRMGGFVGSTIAGFGGAYLGYQGVHEVVKSAGERTREGARETFAGMSDSERARAASLADELSAKYPSVSRTEIMAHVRQLRGRLGSFDHATDNVEALVQAQRVLQTITGGEGASADLEKLVLGLESQGIGAQPEKFKTYMNAFVKAKSLFPDLRGEDFRQYMQAAKSSKYALSEDYLTGVVPTMMQHEGASKFGVEQASAFSALVGGRQTKAAKAAMASFGLMDKTGKVTALDKLISNPYDWATEKLQPALEKKGIEMTEENRGKVVEAVAQLFSNRNVGEFFSSMLINRAIIEKDRAMLHGATGTEGALGETKDPFVALGALTTQMKDFGAALLGTTTVLHGMNSAAIDLAANTKLINAGNFAHVEPGSIADKAIKGYSKLVGDDFAQPSWVESGLDALIRLNRYGSLKDTPVTKALVKQRDALAYQRLEGRRGLAYSNLGPSWEARQELDLEYQRGMASSPSLTAAAGSSNVAQPNAQLQGSAQVSGEVKQTLIIEASEWFKTKMEGLENAIKLIGTLNANGPGSNGRTSPDATPGAGGRGVSGGAAP